MTLCVKPGFAKSPFSSVRFGIGRANTEEEIRKVMEAVAKEIVLLRRMSGGSASPMYSGTRGLNAAKEEDKP